MDTQRPITHAVATNIANVNVLVTGTSEDLEDLRSHALELISRVEVCEIDALETYDLTQLRLTPSRMSAELELHGDFAV